MSPVQRWCHRPSFLRGCSLHASRHAKPAHMTINVGYTSFNSVTPASQDKKLQATCVGQVYDGLGTHQLMQAAKGRLNKSGVLRSTGEAERLQNLHAQTCSVPTPLIRVDALLHSPKSMIHAMPYVSYWCRDETGWPYRNGDLSFQRCRNWFLLLAFPSSQAVCAQCLKSG